MSRHFVSGLGCSLLCWSLSVFALSGCSSAGTPSAVPQNATSGADSGTATVSASNAGPTTGSMKIEAASTGGDANWGADKGAPAKGPSFERGRLLNRGNSGGGAGGGSSTGGQNASGDPYAAQYPKWRLDKAAIIRSWAHVSVVPVGIDAFLKTAWSGGFIHIRLALLGPLNNLQEFSRTQNSVKITFQDRAGNALKQIIVPMSELKQAPPDVNYGTPTYAVEGTMDCPLELYEQVYQWMFEWD